MTPKLPNLRFLRNWRKMQATNTNPIHYIKKKTSQRSSKLVTVLEVNVQTCISTAIWVYSFFFFCSPGLEGWYEFISFSRKFYVYESAILKIFKGNALVWTWLFTWFLCTMQETQTVSNLAVRTSVPHCLLKMSHLVTLAHTCHLLVRHQRNQVCAVKWLFIFFFLSMVGFWLVFFSCLFYQ